MKIISENGLEIFFEDKDYTEIKSIDGNLSLREFIVNMLSYNPKWLNFLYKLRKVLVKIFGLHEHEDQGEVPIINPDEISFEQGDNVSFFIVRKGVEGRYLVCETPKDKHLKAYLGIVEEKLKNGESRFHVFTTIDYLHFTGPIYFNLIRVFHHIVVNEMMKAGVGRV